MLMNMTYRKSCALLAWTVLVLQYIIMLQSGEFGGWGVTTLTYLGYFTILTNILVALAFSVPFFKDTGRLKTFFQRQSVRAAIALYILVVCLVYYGVLAQIHETEGLSTVLNLGLHLILPGLYLVDWVVFAKKGAMSFKHLPMWTLYPIVYGLFVIIRGHLTGFYPYPFLNIDEIGLGRVTLIMFGFVCIYALGGAGFIALGRALTRRASAYQA